MDVSKRESRKEKIDRRGEVFFHPSSSSFEVVEEVRVADACDSCNAVDLGDCKRRLGRRFSSGIYGFGSCTFVAEESTEDGGGKG